MANLAEVFRDGLLIVRIWVTLKVRPFAFNHQHRSDRLLVFALLHNEVWIDSRAPVALNRELVGPDQISVPPQDLRTTIEVERDCLFVFVEIVRNVVKERSLNLLVIIADEFLLFRADFHSWRYLETCINALKIKAKFLFLE